MNVLDKGKRETLVRCFVEGVGVRSAARIVGCSKRTSQLLLQEVGLKCSNLLDVKLLSLNTQKIQIDEIWQFVQKKNRQMTKSDNVNRVGDFWTFVAIDADSRLVISYLVGKRNHHTANKFINDLSLRLNKRVQISTDKLQAYVNAIGNVYGNYVDFSQIKRGFKVGDPDQKYCSTSYVERSNLTMRMSISRMRRLSLTFAKKVSNLDNAIALHFAYYNFCRLHQTIRCTPAMEAGVTPHLWSVSDLLEWEIQPPPVISQKPYIESFNIKLLKESLKQAI